MDAKEQLETIVKEEHEWITTADGGKCSVAGPLFGCRPLGAKEASMHIEEFTKAVPEPFLPSYPNTNPWVPKKENKGKGPTPAKSQRKIPDGMALPKS